MAYKVLIIGCGAIAGGYDAERHPGDWPLSHAGAIAQNDRFELAACVDPDDTGREEFQKRWDVQRSASTPEELGDAPGSFDLIVIASPTDYHAEHLEWALTMKPRAVFCEKPVAKDLAAIRPLIDAFGKAKIPLAVNYTRRWAPDIQQLEGDITNDEWGVFQSAVGYYSKGVVHNGTHMIDLLHMLIGPMELHSVGPADCDYWDDDPSASAILTSVYNFDYPIHLVAGDSVAFAQFELVLTFQYGEIAIRDGGARIETRRVNFSPMFPEYRQLGEPESVQGHYTQAMTMAYRNLDEVIARKAEPNCTGWHALAAHALCDKIRVKALETIKKDPE